MRPWCARARARLCCEQPGDEPAQSLIVFTIRRGEHMDIIVPRVDEDRRAAPTSGVSVENARFDAIVLGAGISGLVSASILLEQGCKRILLVDEYGHVGGNHIDRTIGDYTF